MKRPRRQKKADRLIHPDASADQIRCDYAVAPMDRFANEMDTKWGIDQLPGLVPAEMAEKYGRAIAALNAAIEANDPAEVTKLANNCHRGLIAMDKAATEAGHQPADPDIWEMEINGKKVGLVRSTESWKAAAAKRPDLEIITPPEIALALNHHANPAVEEVKRAFPGATVTDIRTARPKPDYANGGDPIPF